MSDYKIIEPQAGAPSPVSITATVQGWPLGYIAKAEDKGRAAATTRTRPRTIFCHAFLFCSFFFIIHPFF
jgi:hypothetical protein